MKSTVDFVCLGKKKKEEKQGRALSVKYSPVFMPDMGSNDSLTQLNGK